MYASVNASESRTQERHVRILAKYAKLLLEIYNVKKRVPDMVITMSEIIGVYEECHVNAVDDYEALMMASRKIANAVVCIYNNLKQKESEACHADHEHQ